MSQAYPLLWPKGWPRTESNRRERSRFDQELHWALNNLRKQIELMGGKGVVLSSNCSLGHDTPSDPGVVAYFQLGAQAMAIPCDRWDRVRDNIHAIALTVEAMRGMERWGAKHMITAMFNGFRALPERSSGVDFYAVLGLDRGKKLTEEIVLAAYRRKAVTEHPDKPTGSNEKWAVLREAHDLAMQAARSNQ